MNRSVALKSLIPALALVILAACGGSESPDEGKVIRRETISQNGELLPKVKADRLLVVELEGMMCVKGCGSSIRSAMYDSEAVESVSFDFDEDKPVDIARIAYDRSKITPDEIVEILSSMEEGKYIVKNVKSEPYVSENDLASASTSTGRSSKKAKVTIKTQYVETSDIFDIFTFL